MLTALIQEFLRAGRYRCLKYAQQVLDSLAPDVYNQYIVKKCPEYIQDEIKLFENATAAASENIVLSYEIED